MNDLSAYSTEDLQEEIERRNNMPPTPAPLNDADMNWDEVIDQVIEHVTGLGLIHQADKAA